MVILFVTLIRGPLYLLSTCAADINILMQAYAYTSFILYFCLARIGKLGFDAIAQEIRNGKNLLLCLNEKEVGEQIQKWKRKHEIVLSYVHQLNRSVSPNLFVEISGIFMDCFIHPFYVILFVQMVLPLPILSIILLFKHSITLLTICIVSDSIRTEVKQIRIMKMEEIHY